MNISRKLTISALCFTFLLAAGCAGSKNMNQKDLLHHRFVLESIDGVPFESSVRTPDIEFGEGFRVYGGICNRYTGQGELADNVLTVKQMASTKMLCADDKLNKFEGQFAQMLSAGAEIAIEGNTLTLKQGGHVLVYKLADWVR